MSPFDAAFWTREPNEGSVPVSHHPRFAEVTNHSILQGAISSRFIRISGDENGRDHVARFDEMSMELNPAHSGHQTSVTKHAVSVARGDFKNSVAEETPRPCSPTPSSCMDSRKADHPR
jgi:hypothetical protein